MKTYRPQLRTKNHTAAPLRKSLGEFAMRSIIRLGSRTTNAEAFPLWHDKRPIIEVNTAESCHNSGDKIIMKKCFDEAQVKTAKWAILGDILHGVLEVEAYADWDDYPAIIKHKNSCKGQGIYYAENEESLLEIAANLDGNIHNYICEKYHTNAVKEYRLHVTEDGCFYTCRKMLKSDAEDRWHRHDSNSVWIMEENPAFDKPKNWDDVISECVKALKSVGLNVGACDVKIQSEKGKRNDYIPEFIILEVNSAPSMGEVTLVKYREELPKIIQKKINNYGRP